MASNQFIIEWTLKTKSLLPSLYKREEFPLFGRRPIGPLARREKRGKGRFYQHNFKIPLYPPLPKGDKNTRNRGVTVTVIFRLTSNGFLSIVLHKSRVECHSRRRAA